MNGGIMIERRSFVHRFAFFCVGGIWVSRSSLADDLSLTPSQTRGPFYPIPPIDKQQYFDVDLTRKNETAPAADGEMIAVRGKVVDISGQPLHDVIVEVWQACKSGRYNHPNDKNESPLDPNFQYWGRMLTGADGSFAFKTIEPGKYPGRAPHIHFRVVAPKRKTLETQLYFATNEELNMKDGVYKGVPPKQQKAVTTALENLAFNPKDPSSPKMPTGNFQIVLGSKNDTNSTPGM